MSRQPQAIRDRWRIRNQAPQLLLTLAGPPITPWGIWFPLAFGCSLGEKHVSDPPSLPRTEMDEFKLIKSALGNPFFWSFAFRFKLKWNSGPEVRGPFWQDNSNANLVLGPRKSIFTC